MKYSPECVAAFEAKFPTIRSMAQGDGFSFDSERGEYNGWRIHANTVRKANDLLAGFADNWERVKELEEALRRMVGIPASVGVCEPVEGFAKRPQDAVDCMGGMAAEITRLRAALEQGEAVEYWVLFDASGGPKFIKKEVGSGVLAFFDHEFEAEAAKKTNPGSDYQKVVYYKAPPSTAEAQARALEDFARKMRAEAALYRATTYHAAGLYFAAEQADAEAKRIREEG